MLPTSSADTLKVEDVVESDKLSDNRNTSNSTRGLFLEALVDAIEDKVPSIVTQTQTLQNSEVNVKLPSLSSLTHSIQQTQKTIAPDGMYGLKYKEYIAAYTAYCQAYQYATVMAYQQRTFANGLPHSYAHPVPPTNSNTSNNSIDLRQAYPPVIVRPYDDPPFTGRYGHDDLVKAYSQPNPPHINQQISTTSNNNNLSNRVHIANMSDSESLADQDEANEDEDSSDSARFTPIIESVSPEAEPLSYHDTQKRAHKLAERKRRNEMKRLFDQLKGLLPNVSHSERQKLSKWDVLSQTIDTIDTLLHKKALLISKKNYLVPRVEKSRPIDVSTSISDENIDLCNVNLERTVTDSDNQIKDKRSPCLDALVTVVDSQ